MSQLAQRLQLFTGCMNVVFVFLVFMMLTDRLTIPGRSPAKCESKSLVEISAQSPKDITKRVDAVPSAKSDDKKVQMVTKLLQTVARQRNELSEILTRTLHRLGALQCETAKDVNERGAYCLKEVEIQQGFKLPSPGLFDDLCVRLKGKSLASFGEGSGMYVRHIRASGLLSRVDAFDAAPSVNETTGGRVQFLDLSVPNYGLPIYDWILSIETAEHIPAIYEHVFLDNIARHVREGVIMSWAVPGQPGVSHVNCRPFDYVKRKMADIGFRYDDRMSKHYQALGSGLLKTNLNLFVREANRAINDIFS